MVPSRALTHVQFIETLLSDYALFGIKCVFSYLIGDDYCVGNECSDIEAELMRSGGRLAEWLITTEKE